MKTRASGLLLHISSLPSEYGIGDFGPKAYEFADFLSQAGQRYWQVLPLNPIDSKSRYCPYDCLSAFAGNILFISPDLMVEEGFLNKKDILGKPVFPKGKVNFRMVTSYKTKILNIAFKNFKNTSPQKKYQKFCSDNSWLEDYALFSALGSKFHNHQWNSWPKEIKGREKKNT